MIYICNLYIPIPVLYAHSIELDVIVLSYMKHFLGPVKDKLSLNKYSISTCSKECFLYKMPIMLLWQLCTPLYAWIHTYGYSMNLDITTLSKDILMLRLSN